MKYRVNRSDTGSSEYLSWVRRLDLRLPTLAQHRACLYLERHGQRFLVDYGTENAVKKARAHRLLCDVERLKDKPR